MEANDKKRIGYAVIAVVGLYIVGIVITACCRKSWDDVYYFSQIFSVFFVVLGVVVAMMQYIITSNEQRRVNKRELEIREREISEIEKDRIQNAINLANYYKDNILGKITIIDSVYKDTGIKEILENIDLRDMKEFDEFELSTLLPLDKRKQIEVIAKSQKFMDAIVKNSILWGFAEKSRSITIDSSEPGEIKRNININAVELFREYGNVLSMLLNNIEYFAMNFTHHTADESVVYQSLHTTYLSVMQILYYDIAQNNKAGGEKLYTNAIELFNIWRDEAEKQRQGSIQGQRGAVKKGTEFSYK